MNRLDQPAPVVAGAAEAGLDARQTPSPSLPAAPPCRGLPGGSCAVQDRLASAAPLGVAEKWRAVAGFPGYEVSSLGRMRTWKPARRGSAPRSAPHVLKLDGSGRYFAINLIGPGGERARFSVHRLVLDAFVGPCPPGQQALHGPGGRHDNRPENLRWGTTAENGRDKVRFAEAARGARNPNSKLTEDNVREARATGMKARQVAGRWGISETSAQAMINRKTWNWVL